jgi:hypothetical protein
MHETACSRLCVSDHSLSTVLSSSLHRAKTCKGQLGTIVYRPGSLSEDTMSIFGNSQSARVCRAISARFAPPLRNDSCRKARVMLRKQIYLSTAPYPRPATAFA